MPNKLGGVILLGISICCILLLCFLPLNYQANWAQANSFFLRSLFVVVVVLTFLGSAPVEAPFVFLRQIRTAMYFILFLGFSLG